MIGTDFYYWIKSSINFKACLSVFLFIFIYIFVLITFLTPRSKTARVDEIGLNIRLLEQKGEDNAVVVYFSKLTGSPEDSKKLNDNYIKFNYYYPNIQYNMLFIPPDTICVISPSEQYLEIKSSDFTIIDATSDAVFVWDSIKSNMGLYHRVRYTLDGIRKEIIFDKDENIGYQKWDKGKDVYHINVYDNCYELLVNNENGKIIYRTDWFSNF